MLYFYGGQRKAQHIFFPPENGNKAEKPILQVFVIWQISRKTGVENSTKLRKSINIY